MVTLLLRADASFSTLLCGSLPGSEFVVSLLQDDAFSGIGLIVDCPSPSVFRLRFDLCSVAASSFCNLDTTGPFVISLVPFFSGRVCCDRKSSLEGCLASPSYAPILMATFPAAGFGICPFIVADAAAGFETSDTGLVDESFPLTCGLFPAAECRGLPFVFATVFCRGK